MADVFCECSKNDHTVIQEFLFSCLFSVSPCNIDGNPCVQVNDK